MPKYSWQPKTEVEIGDIVTYRTTPGSHKVVKIGGKMATIKSESSGRLKNVGTWELDFRRRG